MKTVKMIHQIAIDKLKSIYDIKVNSAFKLYDIDNSIFVKRNTNKYISNNESYSSFYISDISNKIIVKEIINDDENPTSTENWLSTVCLFIIGDKYKPVPINYTLDDAINTTNIDKSYKDKIAEYLINSYKNIVSDNNKFYLYNDNLDKFIYGETIIDSTDDYDDIRISPAEFQIIEIDNKPTLLYGEDSITHNMARPYTEQEIKRIYKAISEGNFKPIKIGELFASVVYDNSTNTIRNYKLIPNTNYDKDSDESKNDLIYILKYEYKLSDRELFYVLNKDQSNDTLVNEEFNIKSEDNRNITISIPKAFYIDNNDIFEYVNGHINKIENAEFAMLYINNDARTIIKAEEISNNSYIAYFNSFSVKIDSYNQSNSSTNPFKTIKEKIDYIYSKEDELISHSSTNYNYIMTVDSLPTMENTNIILGYMDKEYKLVYPIKLFTPKGNIMIATNRMNDDIFSIILDNIISGKYTLIDELPKNYIVKSIYEV